MGIRKIDYTLCSGCGNCAEVCPLDVIRIDKETGKPLIKYLRDCQSCFLCEIDCPAGAIYVTPDREKIPKPW